MSQPLGRDGHAARASKGINAVEIGYRVLMAVQLGPGSVALSEIAERTGLSAGAAHNYLTSLVRTGLVEREDRGRYRLGPSAFALSRASFRLMNGYDVMRDEARALHELTGQSVGVSVWSQGGPISIYILRSRLANSFTFRPGQLPLLGSGSGLLYVAYLPEAETRELIERELAVARDPRDCATIIAERLADDLSAEYGVLRAPAIEYGVNVDTERGFIGNASVRKKTLHRTLNDLLDSWEATGFKEFILLTAHGHDPHQEALATVITAGARVRVVDIFAVNLSELLEGQTEAMHGDEVDTSIMLHLCPDLVHLELAKDYMMSREQLRRYRRGTLKVPSNSAGNIGLPSLANAEKGRVLYERIRSRISDRIFLAPALAE